ncbi:MAG: phosphoadenosine phosphosulfate reductase family protein [Candidatus Hydrothermarchaeaceae archaeon]
MAETDQSGPDIEEKIEKSKQVLKEALEKYNSKIIVAFTGGKDSMLLLWLVREVCAETGMKMPISMFIDEGDLFEEVVSFVEEIADSWDVDVRTAKNMDVMKQVKELGDTVYVDKLNETNRREISKLGFEEESFPFEAESYVGNHLMKTVAMNNFITENGVEAVITGIRRDEQDARKDETYFSPRESPDHMRVQPILHFIERDVWTAIKAHDIPICGLYEKGYRSLGAKTTTTKTSDKPAWEQDLDGTIERSGRRQDKEGIMKRLRDLGYM